MPTTDRSSSSIPNQATWRIGAYVDGHQMLAANAYARAEAERGAQALFFRLYDQPGRADVARLLEGLDLERTAIHCALRYSGQDPAVLFRDLIGFLRSTGTDLGSVHGSVDFDPLLDWSEPPFPPLIRLLHFVHRWMPNFCVLQVNAGGFNNGPGSADLELGLALAKGGEYLRQLEQRGYPAALAHQHLQFAVTLGEDAADDAAKIVALRQGWTEVLRDFSITTKRATAIAAHTDTTSIGTDEDANRQLLTHQTRAAVAGGADALFLSPTAAGRAAALNVQLAFRNHPTDTITPDTGRVATLLHDSRERYHDITKQGGFAEATVF